MKTVRGSLDLGQESSGCNWDEEKPGVEVTVSQCALRAPNPQESEWTTHPLHPYGASRGLIAGRARNNSNTAVCTKDSELPAARGQMPIKPVPTVFFKEPSF